MGLGPSLLAVQLAVAGKLLATMSPGVQMQVLDALVSCAAVGRGMAKRDPDAASRRFSACVVVGVAALAGLGPLTRKASKAVADPTDKVGTCALFPIVCWCCHAAKGMLSHRSCALRHVK